jgi:hypothetical protein
MALPTAPLFEKGQTWVPSTPVEGNKRSMYIVLDQDDAGFGVAQSYSNASHGSYVFVNNQTFLSGFWKLAPLPKFTRQQIREARAWLIENIEADLTYLREGANAITIYRSIEEQYIGGWNAFEVNLTSEPQ